MDLLTRLYFVVPKALSHGRNLWESSICNATASGVGIRWIIMKISLKVWCTAAECGCVDAYFIIGFVFQWKFCCILIAYDAIHNHWIWIGVAGNLTPHPARVPGHFGVFVRTTGREGNGHVYKTQCPRFESNIHTHPHTQTPTFAWKLRTFIVYSVHRYALHNYCERHCCFAEAKLN